VAAHRRVILDLCSGLGGASEAFLSASNWQVIRIENNSALKDVPHTQLLDVLQWTDWIESIPHPEIIWASPPCREFSTAYAAPGPTAKREGRVFLPDLAIVQACMDIIDYFKPKWAVIENVLGACEHFRPFLGSFHQKVGPFYLWGRFPSLLLPLGWIHEKKTNDTWSTDPLRPNRRALIPFEVSKALLDAVENQMTLEEWYANG